MNNYKHIKLNHKTQKSVIPDLVGMPAMDAVVILEKMGLKFVLKGEGKVINQSIKSGSKVDYSKRIILYLS